MRRRFERLTGVVELAALLVFSPIGSASAGGLSPSAEGDASPSQCGAADRGCVRIRGYIAAGAESSGATTVVRPKPLLVLPKPPFVSALDSAGRAAADAINRGLFFLQASHSEVGQ
jgi:hypothetical protein